jgi:hypothetical protein
MANHKCTYSANTCTRETFQVQPELFKTAYEIRKVADESVRPLGSVRGERSQS